MLKRATRRFAERRLADRRSDRVSPNKKKNVRHELDDLAARETPTISTFRMSFVDKSAVDEMSVRQLPVETERKTDRMRSASVFAELCSGIKVLPRK
jgi:hypothetical protein